MFQISTNQDFIGQSRKMCLSEAACVGNSPYLPSENSDLECPWRKEVSVVAKVQTSSAVQGGKEQLSPQSRPNQQSEKLQHLLPVQCITCHKSRCTGSDEKSKIFFLTVVSYRDVSKEVWAKIKSRNLNSRELWNQNPQLGQKLFRVSIPKTDQIKSLPPSKTLTVPNSVCAGKCEWKDTGSEEKNSTAWTPCFAINFGFKSPWNYTKRVESFCCLFQ